MIEACLAFFSPADYELPRQHFKKTVAALEAHGIRCNVAEVCKPGQSPIELPPTVKRLCFTSDEPLFFKENLWNIAARNLATSEKLLFCDGDISFEQHDLDSSRNFAKQIEDELQRADIIQPFDVAIWLNHLGQPYQTARSSAEALMTKQIPNPGSFHPGFAWAMTREAFEAIDGFFELNVVGSGDLSLAFALCHLPVNELPAWVAAQDSSTALQSFHAYKARANAQPVTFGNILGVRACHHWHGNRNNRRYTQRGRAQVKTHHRADGLLEADDGQSFVELQKMWKRRREDG